MIIETLSFELKEFLKEIENLGFTLTIVGGYPRDYIFSKSLGHDLDFEIRANTSIDKETWPTYYKKLFIFLRGKNISYTELPYLITRFDFGEYKLEFSSPRLEKNKDQDFSHHHFEATLDSNLSHDLSFSRRDFTINAIGVEFDFQKGTDKLIDPYNGVSDLKNKILKNITDDFFNDSVRFLRLVRFKLKFEFEISKDLYARLGEFNLSKLSVHHFKEEIFKSTPGKFFNLFSKLIKDKSIGIPENFKIWTKYTYPEDLFSKEEILAFVFLRDEKDAELVSVFFSLSENKLRNLKSFYRSYQAVKALNKKDFSKLLNLSKEEALSSEVLKDLKNLEDKKEWLSPLHLPKKELLVDWDDWKKVNVENAELNLIKAPLRSYYVYFKAIETKFK